MADRPIIFSTPMVRALLDGRKTQTRRLARLPAEPKAYLGMNGNGDHVFTPTERWGGQYRPPYEPGDRLYVRERLWVVGDGIRFAANDADDYCFDALENHAYHPGRDLWVRRVCNKAVGVPSIHMPRWASRLTLTVEDVRVERLQTISEADAWAEGLTPHPNGGGSAHIKVGDTFLSSTTAEGCFAMLWKHLHGPDSWAANPFVVALTFRVERGNIDTLSREAA